MHPAEKELINGALEQIEASCRTLRRYLAYCHRETPVSQPLATPHPQGFSEEPEPDDDQLERMLAKMMGMPGSGGRDEPNAI